MMQVSCRIFRQNETFLFMAISVCVSFRWMNKAIAATVASDVRQLRSVLRVIVGGPQFGVRNSQFGQLDAQRPDQIVDQLAQPIGVTDLPNPLRGSRTN